MFMLSMGLIDYLGMIVCFIVWFSFSLYFQGSSMMDLGMSDERRCTDLCGGRLVVR